MKIMQCKKCRGTKRMESFGGMKVECDGCNNAAISGEKSRGAVEALHNVAKVAEQLDELIGMKDEEMVICGGTAVSVGELRDMKAGRRGRPKKMVG